MQKKIRVCLLFGGKSAEHEISLLSAKSIIDAIDRSKYDLVLIGIDKNGEWHLREPNNALEHAEDPKKIMMKNGADPIAVAPYAGKELFTALSNQERRQTLDVVFPILHGPNGEDGTVQGLLKLAGIPFVGAGVIGSAIGMDKDVMKRLLRDAGIKTPKFCVFTDDKIDFSEVVQELGLPFFVKPANGGSSIGITRVDTEESFVQAVADAFLMDRKILVEENIIGREIECSVLGNQHPIASLPGEVIPKNSFYSYAGKYFDDGEALFEIPAKLNLSETSRFQELAIRVYKVLCCEGLARVDFFFQENGEILVNEINTLPGFTPTSAYPKLWEASGLCLPDLVDKLIELALERFEREQKLNFSWRKEDERICALSEIQSGDRSR